VAKKKTSESNSTPRPSRSRTPRASAAKTSPRGQGVESVDTPARMRAVSGEQQLSVPLGPSYDEIAQAAYHRYLNRGGQHGADFDDWVEAERELRARRTR